MRSSRLQRGIALRRRLTNVMTLGAFALTLLIFRLQRLRKSALRSWLAMAPTSMGAQLPNPPRDATAIAQMFQVVGFDTVPLRNDVGNLRLQARATRFLHAVARAPILLWCFFAGHGIQIADQNYSIPVDAKLAQDYDAMDEAISLERIIEAIEPAAARSASRHSRCVPRQPVPRKDAASGSHATDRFARSLQGRTDHLTTR